VSNTAIRDSAINNGKLFVDSLWFYF
jgi:hypothetical protein